MARPSPRPALESTGYWPLSQQPLQSLFFLLPLVVLYEVGTLLYVRESFGQVPHILAHKMLRQFFEAIGVGDGAFYLPGLIVVVVLLSLHVARKDRWRFEPAIYPWMAVESLVLSLPLFVMMLVGFGTTTAWRLMASAHEGTSWQTLMVYSVGAGIYEELLFRLIGIALLHMIFADLLALPQQIGAAAAVIGTAVLFALYHFGPGNPFHWGRFTFYSLAGAYFAVVYLLRGFGIVAGTHAMYDVLVVLLQVTQDGPAEL
jgi:membrane protease YdiL (CAAX protease family)